VECPDEEEEECYQVLAEYGVTRHVIPKSPTTFYSPPPGFGILTMWTGLPTPPRLSKTK
jgi:hypothetical protein